MIIIIKFEEKMSNIVHILTRNNIYWPRASRPVLNYALLNVILSVLYSAPAPPPPPPRKKQAISWKLQTIVQCSGGSMISFLWGRRPNGRRRLLTSLAALLLFPVGNEKKTTNFSMVSKPLSGSVEADVKMLVFSDFKQHGSVIILHEFDT